MSGHRPGPPGPLPRAGLAWWGACSGPASPYSRVEPGRAPRSVQGRGARTSLGRRGERRAAAPPPRPALPRRRLLPPTLRSRLLAGRPRLGHFPPLSQPQPLRRPLEKFAVAGFFLSFFFPFASIVERSRGTAGPASTEGPGFLTSPFRILILPPPATRGELPFADLASRCFLGDRRDQGSESRPGHPLDPAPSQGPGFP